MNVNTITYRNFRNIEEAALNFTPGVNILWGNNAQGKTNALEGIYCFACGKSFRGVHDRELLRFGAENGGLELHFTDERRQQHLSLQLFRAKSRQMKKNGVARRKSADFVGTFHGVLFCPEHLAMIKGAPALRRSFLDAAISQLKPAYLAALTDYAAVLKQRNALLKKDGVIPMLLDVYDEKLAEEGSYIMVARSEYIKKLEQFAKIIFSDISKSENKLKLLYINQFAKEVTDREQIKEVMINRFKRTRESDITLKMTCSGIQKDDLLILQNGKSLKYFGSQGQIRSAVLSLILAQADVIHDRFGEYPVIILDDILSELDRTRQKYIFSGSRASQVLVSTCESAKARGKGNIIKVSGGRII